MRIYSLLLAMFVLGACGSNPPIYSGSISAGNQDVQVGVAFTNADRQHIHNYYAGSSAKGRAGMPPGLAKKQHLPPGLDKQLQRNGTLPPGLQRQPLPQALEQRLSRLPDGYVRVRVGQDIVLLNTSTNVMLDVIYGLGQ